MRSLRDATAFGFRDAGLLAGDPLFEPVRADAAFRAILDELRVDVERMRRRVVPRTA